MSAPLNIPELIVLHRQRMDLVRERVSITHRIGAIERLLKKRGQSADGYASTLILVEAKVPLDKGIKELEKKMKALVRQCPVWQIWGKQIAGLGEITYAELIAEADDLSRYSTVAKLWHRFGLHVVDGKAVKRKAGIKLDFALPRRSVAYTVGTCLMKQKGAFKAIYDQQRAYYDEKWADKRPSSAILERSAIWLSACSVIYGKPGEPSSRRAGK